MHTPYFTGNAIHKMVLKNFKLKIEAKINKIPMKQNIFQLENTKPK